MTLQSELESAGMGRHWRVARKLHAGSMQMQRLSLGHSVTLLIEPGAMSMTPRKDACYGNSQQLGLALLTDPGMLLVLATASREIPPQISPSQKMPQKPPGLIVTKT